MSNMAKIDIPSSAKVYYATGTGLTPQNELIRREAPVNYLNSTVKGALDYVLVNASPDGNEGSLADSVSRIMKKHTRFNKRAWVVEINGRSADPSDTLNQYVTVHNAIEGVDGPVDFTLAFKVSEMAGGGKKYY